MDDRPLPCAKRRAPSSDRSQQETARQRKRKRHKGDSDTTASPGRATPDLERKKAATAVACGPVEPVAGSIDAGTQQCESLVDVLPDEVLCDIVDRIHPTSALVRVGSACRRLCQATAFVRTQRTASRRRSGPHADPIGCAHQLLNAISLDDPDGVVDALDIGHVSLDDLLDPDYLWSVATPSVVAMIFGTRAYADDRSVMGRPVLRSLIDDPARTGYYTPLRAAVLCGSVACVRVLVSMGTRMSAAEAGALVRSVASDLAWNEIRVTTLSRPVPRIDDISRADARPRAARRSTGSYIDPVELLSPVLCSLPRGCLSGLSARGTLHAAVLKAIGRLAYACPEFPLWPVVAGAETPVRNGFSPSVDAALDAALVEDFVRAVDQIVAQAEAFATFLVHHGCRSSDCIHPPFGQSTFLACEGYAASPQYRRTVDGMTLPAVVRRFVAKMAKVNVWLPDSESVKLQDRLFTEGITFVLESFVAACDRACPPAAAP
ncbi:hypothetical protein pdul_cds_381 [Pandoravirus dulcis]|uniref:F-box incomplete domain containing protein n=1 Tax=Pandoravirus dulcis TaxID=1349409 RepID=S4VQ60_9VIRU|nr:hypothetical protein pdul_cds_381 [Pandoravirus dulcis]AGO82417.1 hypothetical protein pdul_cds_381 [Pandoravirus dulcis]